MDTTNNNAMMNQEQQYPPFILPDMVGGEFSEDDLAEDMDGLSLSFPRVKIPGGGVPQFEMPGDDPEHPTFADKLEGVILYNHMSNAYWAPGSEYSDDTPPLCRSADGKIGYGEPGGVCAACEFNEFGSDENGSGKACKNMRMLYLLRSGEMMPIVLALPPTSIKPFREFLGSAFVARHRATYGSLVEISLVRKNSNGFDYSVAVFKRVRDFTGDELARVTEYASAFRKEAKLVIEQRGEQNKAAAAENLEMASVPEALPSNEASFAVGAPVLYGEAAKLPA